MSDKELAFVFFGSASVLMRTKTTSVAFDPAATLSKVIPEIKSLDFITYSHRHSDHYNIGNAVKLYKATDAHIFTEVSMAEELASKIPPEKISTVEEFTRVKATEDFEINGTKVIVHRGIHIGPLVQFQMKIGILRVFHGADSGYWLVKKKVDVAFLPTGSPSPTCAPGVALAMAMDLEPKIAVATHGNAKQSKKFKKLVESELPSTEVIIPKRNELVKLVI